jgi:hypothetical protein
MNVSLTDELKDLGQQKVVSSAFPSEQAVSLLAPACRTRPGPRSSTPASQTMHKTAEAQRAEQTSRPTIVALFQGDIREGALLKV